MNHKITPQIATKLFELSRRLPKIKKLNRKGELVASMAMMKVRGKDLIEAGQFKVGKQIIDPAKFYRVRKPVVENHYENLRNNYIGGGWTSVNKYIKSVWRAAFYQLPFKKKAGAILRLIGRLFKQKGRRSSGADLRSH